MKKNTSKYAFLSFLLFLLFAAAEYLCITVMNKFYVDDYVRVVPVVMVGMAWVFLQNTLKDRFLGEK